MAKVSSLLKTVKNVEDEAGRGVRSLENTIDSIDADLEVYDSDASPKIEATPQDLIRSTKVSRVHSVCTYSLWECLYNIMKVEKPYLNNVNW